MNVKQFIDGRAQQIYLNNAETFSPLGNTDTNWPILEENFLLVLKTKEKKGIDIETSSELQCSSNKQVNK